ncbi:MAG: hypothetical protein K9K67_12955 [Bacteriovoracaceae bacterium]|nr:hypothetical protein [Bacteriovoracaceae bacterium]
MSVLYKIIFIFLPAGLLLGFMVMTIFYYCAPLTVSYYFNSVDHNPTHNENYSGMAIPLYYFVLFLILNFYGKWGLIKTGVFSYIFTITIFLICLFGSFSASFNLHHSNRVNGLNAIILMPIELYEKLVMSLTTSIRVEHYKSYIYIPNLPISRSLAKAIEEVKAAADRESSPEKKQGLIAAYEFGLEKLNQK